MAQLDEKQTRERLLKEAQREREPENVRELAEAGSRERWKLLGEVVIYLERGDDDD